MQKTNFLILFFVGQSIFSQNLVSNHSFEEHTFCPHNVSALNNSVSNWSSPNAGSPDYFNSCSNTLGFSNFNGYQKAFEGKGYAGIYVYASDNYREYIQGELKEFLEKDMSYEISFYASLAELSNHAIKEFGVMLSGNKMTNIQTEKVINAKIISKRVNSINYMPIFSKNYYKNKESWIKVSIIYKACGFEKYFIIGSFDSNSKLDTEKLEKSNYENFSYYYIDDVSIEPIEKETPEKQLITAVDEEIPLETSTIYTFKNVLFEFDKSELLAISRVELDKLVNYLKENHLLMIEIYGHTDAIGTLERNNQLSKDRAKAVSDYLIINGVSEERIKWFGFGSSKPIASNQDEEGREKNRRVEYRLFDN